MKFLIVTNAGGDFSATHVQRAFNGQNVGDVINTGIFDNEGEKFNEEYSEDADIFAKIQEIDVSGNVSELMKVVRRTFKDDHYGIWSEQDLF